MKYCLPLAVLLFTVPAAHAQEWGTGGAYMGVGLGQFKYKETDEEFGLSLSDRTSAYRIFGGYRFNDNFAVEGSWGATGDIKESYSEFVPEFGDLTLDLKADFQAWTVRALGMLPLNNVGIFGGVGYYDAEVKRSMSLTGFGSASMKSSEDGATLIGGLQFEIGRMSLRAEYEWFDTDSSIDASTYGLGLLFRF